MFKHLKLLSFLIILCCLQHIKSAENVGDFPEQNPYTRVLQVDGGGIRGAYAAAVLQLMHTKITESCGIRLCDFFKGGMSGTSTGSFIVLALAAKQHKQNGEFVDGPYTPTEISEFYEAMGETIFQQHSVQNCHDNCCHHYSSSSCQLAQTVWSWFTCGGCLACCYNGFGYCGPRYSNHALKSALEDRFGKMKLSDTLIPVQVAAYDITLNKPIYFNSVEHPEMLMVDAALASAAAPTFFPAVNISDGEGQRYCVDGGLFDNSSALAALRFSLKNYERDCCHFNGSRNIFLKEKLMIHLEDLTVVSIGTGVALKASRVNTLKRAGKVGWARDAVEISMTGSSQAAHFNIAEIFEIREQLQGRQRYFRFQTIIAPSESQMDDYSQISTMANHGRNIKYEEKYKSFTRYVDLSVKNELISTKIKGKKV